MNSTTLRYRSLNVLANILLIAWRQIINWRGVSPLAPLPTKQQQIEEDITSLIYELQLPTSRTTHQMLTEWLNKSSMTPNEYDEAWWDEFENDLSKNRLNFNRTDELSTDFGSGLSGWRGCWAAF